MLNPGKEKAKPFVTSLLEKTGASVTVSSTDYIRAYSDQIREYVPGKYVTLGTDGFGRSDYRKALREFFEVNRYYVVLAALNALAEAGQIDATKAAEAISKYGINTNKANPWEV
jgi:pyruvate dehydrogenase E1 component